MTKKSATQRSPESKLRTRRRRTGSATQKPAQKADPVKAAAEQDLGLSLTEEQAAAADKDNREGLKKAGKTLNELRLRRRTHRGFESKKRTKKEEKRLRDWKGKNAGRKINTLVHSLSEDGKKAFGHRSVGVASELESLTVGIPQPLAMDILLQQDAFPLGVFISIVGPEASLKTSLVFECSRLFQNASGLSVYIPNESKESVDLAPSILGREHESQIRSRSDSLESWQAQLTYWINTLQKYCIGTKNEPGVGRNVPALFAVDSIMGKLSQESSGKIDDAGYADRAHPVEALKITRYLKYAPQKIEDWPFTVILVNQLKTQKDQKGLTVRNLAGGKQVQFQQTFEIETSVLSKLIKSEGEDGGPWKGKVIQLKLTKSQCEDGRKIRTRMLWKYETDPETGEVRQVSWFDWNWSIIDYLRNLVGVEREAVAKVLHFKILKTGPASNTVWSSTLGVPESAPVSWSTLGHMIQQDPVILSGLRRALNIKPRAILEDTKDYAEQLEQVAQELES